MNHWVQNNEVIDDLDKSSFGGTVGAKVACIVREWKKRSCEGKFR